MMQIKGKEEHQTAHPPAPGTRHLGTLLELGTLLPEGTRGEALLLAGQTSVRSYNLYPVPWLTPVE